ncbi:DUF3108 domain-containing protein [Martelella mediterranea]|uniref:Uncharacterized protein DUF3108 n=1 Tax=Martelella mediterranea TaxID=293089 RepID=A0A4R3NWY3_9HYPH|nr:DUF3108 domain-containing protein [Martelella mediterranea]TCT45119.1 uncharacterized protein DUF3108 [Martelella mediterranea]
MRRTAIYCLAVISIVLTGFASASAEDISQETVYTLSFSGIRIANAAFNTTVKDNRYSIAADIKAAGLGSLFSDIAVDVKAEGVWKNNKPETRQFDLTYREGDDERTYSAAFSRNRVTSAEVNPPHGPRGPDWVEVESRHLRNVIDPISALLLPASKNPCYGEIAIFDGETRLNLELAPVGSRPFSTTGFSGRAIGCAVRFRPIAGYEREDDDIEYLANTRELVVWFAFNDELQVYAPVMAKIPLKIGQLQIYASKFGV